MFISALSRYIRLALNTLVIYFLRGVFFFLPALATIYVISITLSWLDNILPTGFPGLGILLLFLGLTVLGYISTHWIGPTLLSTLEDRIRKIPFVGFFYSSVRELVNTSRRSYRFDYPVLFRPEPNSSVYQIGFLTNEHPIPGYDLVAVFAPFAFSALTGRVFLVPRSEIILLNMRGTEALKLILSGGFVTGQSSAKDGDS
ncbi:MAG: DUF502 domain-containing protein [Bacteroidia bacterium]|nr:DUF502 domain-containing protein [Bacteroidia bacterium]MCX7652574.1 DUF502 domain-containing protein [Bacteroidia bacterium]MDW8417164.1 DUF502 domain-containing protein [Bacteroidia bacterium]